MVFDGSVAKALYIRYISTRNDAILQQLLQLCAPLVEVIATDLSKSDRYREDLIQEGLIKLMMIFKAGKFTPNGNPKGGDFHAWLSFTLRNTMIDYLRRQHDYACIDDHDAVQIESDYLQDTVNVTEQQATAWLKARFATLPEELLHDAALYLYCAIPQQVNRRSTGIITTLSTSYDVDSAQARLLYDSMRVYISDIPVRYEQFAIAAAGYDKFSASLFPELVLVTGYMSKILYSIFQGSTLKF